MKETRLDVTARRTQEPEALRGCDALPRETCEENAERLLALAALARRFQVELMEEIRARDLREAH
ncbi:hypothetical protein [Variovorax sp. Sphag1AA]|uniref:hypothetical protein n=1 Tax=Variovorax sp. Sphag1AA TaxID=2587027 RepID=UPI0016179853|nr:hypothetical protein [Variovorax sp. Sphag1AA]MBB3181929.1 hypothetical protein [Variovorax sp. Sphag1AA]